MISARGIWSIGIGQLVNWGVLFFAFGVVLVPVEETLQAPRWIVTGAFSLALLVSAFTAPAVGRLADRGLGPVVMRTGGLAAAGLLIAWALVPTIWMTYLTWMGLGVCMSAILYEPVFVIVGRAFSDADDRLRAIATVTVMGGLASTVFLPGTTYLVARSGWQSAIIELAVVIAVTTLIVSRLAFAELKFSASAIRDAVMEDDASPVARVATPIRLVLIFAITAIVNSAVASNIVAALMERSLTPARAAIIGGMLGLMQLPGRLLMTRKSFTPGPIALLVVSLVLQIAGLLAMMVVASQAALWIGVSLFACGAGLTTLARPYLVLQVYGAQHAGQINGVIARGQQLARAAGPVAAAAVATSSGYPLVFAMLAALLGGGIALVPRHGVQRGRPDV